MVTYIFFASTTNCVGKIFCHKLHKLAQIINFKDLITQILRFNSKIY